MYDMRKKMKFISEIGRMVNLPCNTRWLSAFVNLFEWLTIYITSSQFTCHMSRTLILLTTLINDGLYRIGAPFYVV